MTMKSTAQKVEMAGIDECRRGADRNTASTASSLPKILTIKRGSQILRRVELIPSESPKRRRKADGILRTPDVEYFRRENPNKRIKIIFKVGPERDTIPTQHSSEEEAQEYRCTGDQALRGYAGPHTCSGNMVNCMMEKCMKNSRGRKRKTLVLDLDETLLHSTFAHCNNPNCNISVLKRKHARYVIWRPYLQMFLMKVAEMFEIVIFTAGKRRYASQLIGMMDPERKIISKRLYRDSCQVLNGKYAKDLRILGIDLAKVAIVDNSPHVYQLQVNNGIPIKSFYSDPSDRALIDLLPFLETLADAVDVRPLIAKQFSSKKQQLLV